MDSFGRPVEKDPQGPYKYKVDAVQEQKGAKESPKKPLQEPPRKSVIGAYLLSLFRKIIDLFEPPKETGISLTSGEETLLHLKDLKSIFETLKKEDRNQDSSFLNHFSKIWHEILEDSLCLKKTTPLAKKFKALIQSIQRFPETQQHTLGYYLIEYAGQKWLPFPYMELIQKIYTQHQKEASSSALSEWTQKIDELLQILDASQNKEGH